MPSRSRRSRRSEVKLELGPSKRVSQSGWPVAFKGINWSWRHSLAAVLGLALAVPAVAQSAAQIGLAIPALRTMGPNFYAWTADQTRIDRAMQTPNMPKPTPTELTSHGQWLLSSQPMQAAGLRTLAYAHAARDNGDKARQTMVSAAGLTRRDPLTQIWLIDDAMKRRDVDGLMRHFDYLLRTQPEARSGMLDRVSMLLNVPEARRALLPRMTRTNPWFEDLIIQASDDPRTAIGAAEFLSERGWAPGGARMKPTYGALLSNLVRAGRFDLVRRIYAMLPAADPATLSSVSLNRVQFNGGYVPLTWSLSSSGDFGGLQTEQVGGTMGIEAYAQSLTRGIAAEKLLFLNGAPNELRWKIAGMQANPGSEAYWQVDCLDGGNTRTIATSSNLFELPRRQLQGLTIPAACQVAMVRLTIAGGSGRSASTITVSDTSLRAIRR